MCWGGEIPDRTLTFPAKRPGLNVIDDDENKSIANLFCFGAFADKRDGVVYNDLTGLFRFMSLDGSVYFFVIYHYQTNAILVTPVVGLGDKKHFQGIQNAIQ